MEYYEGSRGLFRPVPKAWVQKVLASARVEYDRWVEDVFRGVTRSRGFVVGLPDRVTLGNHTWALTHVSVSPKFESVSIYFETDSGLLLRLSDHWSESNLSTNNCGNIRKCWWTLSGHSTQPVPLDGCRLPLTGGICRKADLEYL